MLGKKFHANFSSVQQFTSPYSPHQNGIAARYWRMVFDNVRALLLSSKLPEFFWVRAVDIVVYTKILLLMMIKHPTKWYLESNPMFII